MEQITRRTLLAGCAAAGCGACRAAGASIVPAIVPALPAARAKVRVVFSHPPANLEGWPYVNFDYPPRQAELLSKLRAACPEIDFLPATMEKAEDANQILAADSEVDGYALFLLGIPGPGVGQIAASGRPVVTVNELYAGGIGKIRGPKLVSISSSDFQDAADAVRSFDCMKKLRASKILVAVDRERPVNQAIESTFGTKVQTISARDLNAAYDAADRAESQKYAKTWIQNAERIVEPSTAEIGRSGQMYIGMRDLMQKHGAQAIAIDCLTYFYAGKMPAYPCLGFFQLNDDGLVGACEADLQSTITMLALAYLVRRPGYISDPVIDTAKKQVIYAHCVAPSKPFGADGPANPFHIRSHSEDRKGAAIRSLLPLGEITTTLKFVPEEKTVVMHQGKTAANVDDDRACRTKLAVEYPNAQKLLDGWSFGWHRVTVYGDYRERIRNLSALLGIKVVEEG